MSLKISQLTASSGITPDDIFPVVNEPSGSPQTLKVTAQQILDYVTGSTFNQLVATTVSSSIVSASIYLGLPTFSGTATPNGPDGSIQYKSGSEFAGTSSLVYNYTTDTLSGTNAQFSSISSSVLHLSGANSIELNDNAYVLYNSSIDKLEIFPGLYVSGSITASNSISSSVASFSAVTASVVSASTYIGIPNLSESLNKIYVNSSISLSSSQRVVFATNALNSVVSITLPAVSSAESKEYYVIKSDSLTGSIFVSGNLTDTINGQNVYEINGPYQSITLISDNTSSWYVF